MTLRIQSVTIARPKGLSRYLVTLPPDGIRPSCADQANAVSLVLGSIHRNVTGGDLAGPTGVSAWHAPGNLSPGGRVRRAGMPVKITAIDVERLRLPLDPPFLAAWDPVPRAYFDASLVRGRTDEGVTGYGSGDTMH